MHKFIGKHWPHLIVIGASSLDCRQLKDDIKAVCGLFAQARPPLPAGACVLQVV